MSRINIVIIFLVGILSNLNAQEELGTHFMRDIWQAGLSNPALTTNKRLEIGLPSLYFNVGTTGVKFGELVRTDSDGVNRINISEVINNLEDENYLGADVEVETFRLAFKVKELQLSFHHAIHSNNYFSYPKDLAELILLGNAGAIGETMELGPDIQLTAYNEFALGLAQKFGKIGVGARVKFLTGIGNATTAQSDLTLFTDEDIYQLTLTSDILLNTSSFLRINGVNDFDLGVTDLSGADLFTKNNGLAFDLGFTFELTDRLQLAASVRDIGKINWNDNVVNYRSQETINYDGIMLDSILQGSSVPFQETLDSLQDVVAFSETNDAYTTTLPLKTYLSASYQFSDTWTFGALLHTTSFRENTSLAMALSARAKLGKICAVGATLARRNQSFDNLGLNFTLHLGPAAIYAMTDNILTAVQPGNSQNFNVRTGLNLAF